MSHTSGEWISIATDGGAMDVYRLRAPKPAGRTIVLLQEIFGVTASLRSVAQSMALDGFDVLVPDLFWRLKPRVELGYDREGMKQAFDLLARFDEEAAARDIAAVAASARTNDAAAAVHVVGFCLGGKLAVLASGDSNIASAISFYGVDIDKRLDPLQGNRCPLQFHFGTKDKYVPPQAVAAIQDACATRAADELYVYEGVDHGFFAPGRPAYDATAATQAWRRALAFMDNARV
jgi:carboxymethylenebutenolidase